METPLTPLEFARRARKLYPDRVAVIDGDSRWTYAQFLDRCDRWSAALQKLGIKPRDRVAYLSPNTHTQLESFYAVPQIGAVLVPLNYRLTADDFVYLINHSGSRIVCVDRDYLDAIDSIRSRLPCVEHFVALNAQGENWLDYEAMIDASPGEFTRPEIHETDLLTINYTSGTTAHPKGVMITHRNAWMNSIGTLLHVPMTCADRYLWTLPMFHANGWTFVWTVTAVGATHICLRKVEPRAVFELMAREQVTTLCAAPTVLISLANAPETSPSPGAEGNSRCHGRCAARGFHHPATRRRVWLDDHPCLRTDRDSAVHHRVRATGGTRGPPDRRTGRDQSPPGCGANYIR